LFTCDFFYPERNDINIYDTSVILNNAIDNAIEGASACENPYIKILSYRKNNAYMIEIRNSVKGRRIIDEDSGLPHTTKEGEGHGFGLANIRKVAQKYYGDIVIEQKDGEFVLAVMLMLMID
ncbi:MAG: sensor histidine kinase, partial [Lachnospiraceae bacterium]|nr:sensor histidine kinase [Lachnospiraceae bacterium]